MKQGFSIKLTAEQFKIPQSTLHRYVHAKMNKKQTKPLLSSRKSKQTNESIMSSTSSDNRTLLSEVLVLNELDDENEARTAAVAKKTASPIKVLLSKKKEKTVNHATVKSLDLSEKNQNSNGLNTLETEEVSNIELIQSLRSIEDTDQLVQKICQSKNVSKKSIITDYQRRFFFIAISIYLEIKYYL